MRQLSKLIRDKAKLIIIAEDAWKSKQGTIKTVNRQEEYRESRRHC